MTTQNFTGKWTKFGTAADVNQYISQLEIQVEGYRAMLDGLNNQVAALQADLDAARKAIKALLLYWDNNSPVNLQYDKLTDYVRELRTVYAAPQAAQAQIDETELPHTCGVCGHALQFVRPGKWQCVNCEKES